MERAVLALGLEGVLTTSDGHSATLTGVFDFQRGVSYLCYIVAVAVKRAVFEK